MSVRAVLIGSVKISVQALERLFENRDVDLVGVVCKGEPGINSDFSDLAPVARELGVPYLSADGQSDVQIASFIRKQVADVVFCVGWSSLLGEATLSSTPHGVIGYHPAALPANRGRHPIIWAIALGLDSTASTFFVMDKRADAGPIVSQQSIRIDPDDTAADLYERLSATAMAQIDDIVHQLIEGTLRPKPQREEAANVWRKRTAMDGQIDWRMSSHRVYALVRALARPYAGAHLVLHGVDCKVWRAALGENAPDNLEPGLVLASDSKTFTVKCGEGSIVILEHEAQTQPEVGAYL